jgi:hypothetical protein
MDRQQTLQSKRSDSRLTAGRRVFSPRLWILVALIALSLTTAAYGQFDCLSECQRQLAGCLQTGGDDPIVTSICQDNYDACCAACIGF